MGEKKKRQSLSAFSIIFLIIIVLALITRIPMEGVVPAGISDVFMSPFNGFKDAVDVCVFVLFLGGFLGLVTKTGALDAGIAALVKKLKGRELILIPILMFLFSLGGTTYGMAEETIAFYVLICGTMYAAGFDTMVGATVILLGAGVGVLGSTVNPFATGVAISTFKGTGIEINNGTVMILGTILWLTSYLAATWYVMRYAKKIKEDKGSIFLSLQEKENMKKEFGHIDLENVEYTTKHKITLLIFAFTFVIMILSLIVWSEYDIHFFESWTAFLTGVPLGEWYFGELACWFVFMGIVIAVVNNFSEKETVDTFMAGSADLLSVVLIIALSRGVYVIMSATHLDAFLLNHAVSMLQGLPGYIFAPASYVVYMGLTFLIPSTSGLAGATMPVMGPLAHGLGFSPEVMIMIFSAASGIINLITPTSAVVMGGLATARVEYSTYIKWVAKLLGIIFILNVVILTIAIMVF
ncbi:YfcC family protein [Oceanivirga miroungae]|uniref:C4-dicarboxylate anaerobic carrier n=1 Tax=Oceanivirga miroungae TaxID=1130046 RepID=A0A6I8M544_9FUSO|nr:YfcC family protein [Oceanivirga miroungae]VWL85048.1 hypothetical protein OMES3154_00324 [Oceanivirga miroungae]